eukprot:6214768-Pleurochrysis_carterae.AAC.2
MSYRGDIVLRLWARSTFIVYYRDVGLGSDGVRRLVPQHWIGTSRLPCATGERDQWSATDNFLIARTGAGPSSRARARLKHRLLQDSNSLASCTSSIRSTIIVEDEVELSAHQDLNVIRDSYGYRYESPCSLLAKKLGLFHDAAVCICANYCPYGSLQNHHQTETSRSRCAVQRLFDAVAEEAPSVAMKSTLGGVAWGA